MNKEEAEKHLKAAQKASKSGFLKKPDWDVAATEYEKAANIYQQLKLWKEALGTWEDTSQAHYKAKNYYFAARALEAISRISQDSGDIEKAADTLERASTIYVYDEKPDKQADALVRAAKLLIAKNPPKSVELLASAISVYEDTKKWHLSGEAFRTLTSVFLKTERYDDAIANIKRQFPSFASLEQPHNIHKGFVEIIILQLYKGDTVAAEKALEEGQNVDSRFLAKEEGDAANALVEAVKSRDPEKLAEVTKKPTFTFITTEIARLVKKIKIMGASAAVPRPEGKDSQNPISDGKEPLPNLDELDPDMT